MRKSKGQTFGKIERNNRLFYAAIVIFPIAQFLVFYVFVNINSILLAFKKYEYDGGGVYAFAGLRNFANVFKNFAQLDYIWVSLKNSLLLYLFGLLIGIPVALLFSYYIYKKSALSGLFKVILFLPSIISSIIMVIIFRYFSERAIPEIVNALFGIKMQGLLENTKSIFPTLLFYNLFIGFGGNVLLYTGAMNAIDKAVVEAAEIDGAGYFRQFISITVPQVFPTISTFLIVGIAGIFTNEMNLYAFFGPNADSAVTTVGYILFRDTMVGTVATYPYLAAFGLVLTVISIPLVLLVKKATDKMQEKIGC